MKKHISTKLLWKNYFFFLDLSRIFLFLWVLVSVTYKINFCQIKYIGLTPPTLSVCLGIAFCTSHVHVLPFFFQGVMVDFSPVNSTCVHCSRDPQTSLFSKFFIKNESHCIIHTFKSYFTTMFSVFNCIQTDPKTQLISWPNNKKTIITERTS